MKYTKEQLEKKYTPKYWAKVYLELLSIENDQKVHLSRAAELTNSEDSLSKINKLLQNKNLKVTTHDSTFGPQGRKIVKNDQELPEALLVRKNSPIVIEKTPSDYTRVTVTPEVLYGETFATVSLLITEITATPEDYPDGTPVYIETIEYDTPTSDDPISSTGWVIIYGGIPVPVVTPTPEHWQGWINTYNPPIGTFTFVDPNGDGDGDVYVNDGGGSGTTGGMIGTTCIAGYNHNYFSFTIHPTSQVSGIQYGDFAAELIETGDIR